MTVTYPKQRIFAKLRNVVLCQGQDVESPVFHAIVLALVFKDGSSAALKVGDEGIAMLEVAATCVLACTIVA